MNARRVALGVAVGVPVVAVAVAWIARDPATGAWFDRAVGGGGTRPHAPVHETPVDVPGWSGDLPLPDGGRCTVSLARLHADPRRQQLDAHALRQRLRPNVSEGEPFLCQITRRAAAGASAAATPRPSASDASPVPSLASLTIVDDAGTALVAFPSIGTVEPDRLVDPLASLVAPPDAPLAAGRTVAMLVFGREPGTGARAVFGAGPSIALEPVRLATGELEAALARIDGKNGASSGVDGVRR